MNDSDMSLGILDDFDWDAYENSAQTEQDSYTNNSVSEMPEPKEGDILEATVVTFNKREVVVNIGYKTDSIIPISEIRYKSDLTVGDVIEVFVEGKNKFGLISCSHKKSTSFKSLGSNK